MLADARKPACALGRELPSSPAMDNRKQFVCPDSAQPECAPGAVCITQQQQTPPATRAGNGWVSRSAASCAHVQLGHAQPLTRCGKIAVPATTEK